MGVSQGACFNGGRFMVVDWMVSHPPFGEAKCKYIGRKSEYYGRNKGKQSSIWFKFSDCKILGTCPIDSVILMHQQILTLFFFNFIEIEPEGQDSESTCSALSPVQGKKPFCNTFETKPSSNLLFSKQITLS